MHIEKNYWDVLDRTNLVSKNICQSKNDYKSGGIFCGLFLAPKKQNTFLTTDEVSLIQQHVTSGNFNDSKGLLDQSQ